MRLSLKHEAVPWRVVPALGIAQIISWGALYYAITVLGAAIGADLALSPTAVFGAFSVGLLLSGLVSPLTGRAIDRYGGRRVLALGSLVAAGALFFLSRVHSPATYYVAWCVAGVAMAMTLYDPAFATLSQHFGTSYRTALTALTLFGGFASTVFWPLSQLGLAQVGWRDTLAMFAAAQLVICLPLHWLLIPEGRGHRYEELPSPATRPGERKRSRPSARFLALATAFALNAFVFSALSAHMVVLMRGTGIGAEQAVWIAALIGPMQVAGRVIEITAGRNLRATTVGTIAFGLLIAALLVLLSGMASPMKAALAFAVLYGLSNGVMTIVRGTVPAEFFGRDAYGSLLGRLAAPSLVTKALAPVTLASLIAPNAAATPSLFVLFGVAIVSLAAFIAAVRLSAARSA